MAKKRVCFIAQFPPPIHGLSKAVDTLFNSISNTHSFMSENFEFEKVDITSNKKIFENFLKIRRSKADLFYFTISQTKYGNMRDLMILKLLSIQNKKCIVHLHGGYYRQLVDNDLSSWQRKENYKAIKKISGAIVLGNSLKNIFEGMIDDEKIFVIPNCIDDEYLMTDEAFEKKISMLENKKIKDVLYLSNFIKTKGYLEVLEMAKIEKNRCEANNPSNPEDEKKLQFNFAGKFFAKADETLFFDYIKKNNLEDYVIYHGIVGGEKKRELLEYSDVFILLTRYPNEGQPISILEAMGNGILIVTTNHAGIPDVVTDKMNGIVLNKNLIDINKCYLTICDVLNDTTLKNISVGNRSLVKKIYNQEAYVKNIGEIMYKIIWNLVG